MHERREQPHPTPSRISEDAARDAGRPRGRRAKTPSRLVAGLIGAASLVGGAESAWALLPNNVVTGFFLDPSQVGYDVQKVLGYGTTGGSWRGEVAVVGGHLVTNVPGFDIDGTAQVTGLYRFVGDVPHQIDPAAGILRARFLHEAGGHVYFVGFELGQGYGLFRTDGATIQQIGPIYGPNTMAFDPDVELGGAVALNGQVYLLVWSAHLSPQVQILRVSGVSLVPEVSAGQHPLIATLRMRAFSVSNLGVAGSKLVYVGRDAAGVDRLFAWDGVAAAPVAQLNDAAMVFKPEGRFVAWQGAVYTWETSGVQHAQHAHRLLVYDGSAPPTPVGSWNAGYGPAWTGFAAGSQTLFWQGQGQIWSYDGAGAPSAVSVSGSGGAFGALDVGPKDVLLFSKDLACGGAEPHLYDQTVMDLLADLETEPCAAQDDFWGAEIETAPVQLGSSLYFFAVLGGRVHDGGEHQLWKLEAGPLRRPIQVIEFKLARAWRLDLGIPGQTHPALALTYYVDEQGGSALVDRRALTLSDRLVRDGERLVEVDGVAGGLPPTSALVTVLYDARSSRAFGARVQRLGPEDEAADRAIAAAVASLERVSFRAASRAPVQVVRGLSPL